jgi:hypothetical protein
MTDTGWNRDDIINALAAKFGPHKAYDRATRSYLPDGNDAEGSCMISELHEYVDDAVMRTETILRSLTYGDVADALIAAADNQPKEASRQACLVPTAHKHLH